VFLGNQTTTSGGGFATFHSSTSVSGNIDSSVTGITSTNKGIRNDGSTFNIHWTTIDKFGAIRLKANRTTKGSTSISISVTSHFYLKEKYFLR
jgi:hypothetical protein